MSTTPEQLARRAAAGDGAAFESLCERMEGLMYSLSTRYYVADGDRDDLMQEARIALWKAVRDWRPGREASFPSFARLCIERQIITAVKAATRRKHAHLNAAVPIHLPQFADGKVALADRLPDRRADIVERLIEKERLLTMLREMAMMSKLEQRSLWLIEVAGSSYEAAAAELGASVKTVDNAVQRARRKLDAALKLAAPAAPRCDICDNEVAVGERRCGPCEEEVQWARQFVAA